MHNYVKNRFLGEDLNPEPFAFTVQLLSVAINVYSLSSLCTKEMSGTEFEFTFTMLICVCKARLSSLMSVTLISVFRCIWDLKNFLFRKTRKYTKSLCLILVNKFLPKICQKNNKIELFLVDCRWFEKHVNDAWLIQN